MLAQKNWVFLCNQGFPHTAEYYVKDEPYTKQSGYLCLC